MCAHFDSEKIQTLLKTTRQKVVSPGMFLSISYKENISSFSSGSSKLKSFAPISIDHQFRIASVSKTLTSIAIARLVEQGKISFNERIDEILEIKFRFSKEIPTHKRFPPKIIHLLTHTSGLGEFITIKDVLNPRKMFSVWTGNPDQKPSQLTFYNGQTFDLYNSPGEKWYYANHGFGLLGAMIEKITKTRFKQAIKDLVLNPLRMKRTTFEFPGTKEPFTTGTYVLGRKKKKIREAKPINIIDEAAGSAVSTPADLLKFGNALINAYNGKEEAFLSKLITQKIWSPFYSPSPEMTGMGLGFFIVNRKPLILEHGGTINGYNTLFLIVPEKRVLLLTYINRISPLFFKEGTKFLRNVLSLMGINWPHFSKELPNQASKTLSLSVKANYRAGPYSLNRFRFITEFGNEFKVLSVKNNEFLLIKGRSGALKKPLWVRKIGITTEHDRIYNYYLGFHEGKPMKIAIVSFLSNNPEESPKEELLYESINTVRLYPRTRVSDRINEKITKYFAGPLIQFFVSMVIK